MNRQIARAHSPLSIALFIGFGCCGAARPPLNASPSTNQQSLVSINRCAVRLLLCSVLQYLGRRKPVKSKIRHEGGRHLKMECSGRRLPRPKRGGLRDASRSVRGASGHDGKFVAPERATARGFDPAQELESIAPARCSEILPLAERMTQKYMKTINCSTIMNYFNMFICEG